MPLCERERIKNTGHTTLLFLFSKFPAPSSSEAQTKHFIPGSVAKTERVCHPHFRDACEQYHEHERGGKEALKKSLSGFSPRQQMFLPFSPRQKILPLTTLSKSNE